MILKRECYYKDIPAVQISNEWLQVTVLPYHGGKIASIYDLRQKRELLYERPGSNYRVLTSTGDYCEAECSGFDDLFPTVDGCKISGRVYPDHGELCRVKWTVKESDAELKLSVHSEILPVQLRKTISLNADVVRIDYRLMGEANRDPWLWAAHCMISTEPGGKLEMSHEDRIRIMFADNPPEGLCEGTELKEYTLDQERRNFKFYCEKPRREHSVWYTRPDGSGLELNVRGDCRYLGMWINQFGFHNCCCVGLEPSTQPQDIPGSNSVFNDYREWVLTIRSYDESEAVGRR